MSLASINPSPEIVSMLGDLVEDICKVFESLRYLNDVESGYYGGILCVANANNGLPYMLLSVGEVWPGRFTVYLDSCLEQALRLASHPTHLSSAESRDDDAQHFPGAIRINDIILSFAGLDWALNESMVLCAARKICLLDDVSVTQLATLSGNTLIAEALKA